MQDLIFVWMNEALRAHYFKGLKNTFDEIPSQRWNWFWSINMFLFGQDVELCPFDIICNIDAMDTLESVDSFDTLGTFDDTNN